MPSLWQVNNCFKVTPVSAIENDSVFGPHLNDHRQPGRSNVS